MQRLDLNQRPPGYEPDELDRAAPLCSENGVIDGCRPRLPPHGQCGEHAVVPRPRNPSSTDSEMVVSVGVAPTAPQLSTARSTNRELRDQKVKRLHRPRGYCCARGSNPHRQSCREARLPADTGILSFVTSVLAPQAAWRPRNACATWAGVFQPALDARDTTSRFCVVASSCKGRNGANTL